MMSAPDSAPTAAPRSDLLEPWRLLISSAVVLLALVAAAAAVGFWYREPLMRVSRGFVDTLGGFGVALGFFLPDAFTIPLPNDVVAVLGLAGGMSFLEVTLWAVAGSLLGGATGYWIGRGLRTTRLLTRVFERRGGSVQKTLERYGFVAVAVAAITPMPYSIFCWAAGAGRLPFKHFLLVSQLRWLRVAGYLYLIQLGLVSVGV